MALSYGRAGRLTAKNGGFRPGQVHERLEAMDAKLDRIRADIRGLAGDSPGDVA